MKKVVHKKTGYVKFKVAKALDAAREERAKLKAEEMAAQQKAEIKLQADEHIEHVHGEHCNHDHGHEPTVEPAAIPGLTMPDGTPITAEALEQYKERLHAMIAQIKENARKKRNKRKSEMRKQTQSAADKTWQNRIKHNMARKRRAAAAALQANA